MPKGETLHPAKTLTLSIPLKQPVVSLNTPTKQKNYNKIKMNKIVDAYQVWKCLGNLEQSPHAWFSRFIKAIKELVTVNVKANTPYLFSL